jgi:hypothetical protein
LIYFHAARKLELYNLADDIGETKNLAGSHPERTTALASRLTQYLERVNAQMPILQDTGQPVPWPDTIQ